MVSGINDTVTCGASPTPCTVPVHVTTLQQPPTQAQGGGYNSTLAAGSISLFEPLAAGDSINLQFVLGVVQGGTFRIYLNIEALNGQIMSQRPAAAPQRR